MQTWKFFTSVVVGFHKDSVYACVLISGKKKEIKTFGTMTGDLLELCKWLKEKDIQMVAMESTGSYWKPIFNLLEVEEIPAILVNAQHIKAVPGKKTDMKDSEWIAKLLRHGLLKASFVQPRQDRETKELVRYRGRSPVASGVAHRRKLLRWIYSTKNRKTHDIIRLA